MNNTDTAKDLRNVYLTVYGGFAVSPSDIAEQFKTINLRYARELLATLVEAGLVTKIEDGDGNDAWQSVPTYDDMDTAEAEAKIDTWLAKNMDAKPEKAPRKAKEVTYKPCLCGCGDNVPSTSFYRPGHDARHAGMVGRLIAANYTVKGFDRREVLNDLPSERLVAKAEGIAEKAIEKIEAKANREAEREQAKAEKEAAKDPKPAEGTVKVGKNEFVAHRFADGRVVYFDAKGDEKVASKTAAATFAE